MPNETSGPEQPTAEERRYTDTQNAMTAAFAAHDPNVPDDVKVTIENMRAGGAFEGPGAASAIGAAAALVRDTKKSGGRER